MAETRLKEIGLFQRTLNALRARKVALAVIEERAEAAEQEAAECRETLLRVLDCPKEYARERMAYLARLDQQRARLPYHTPHVSGAPKYLAAAERKPSK